MTDMFPNFREDVVELNRVDWSGFVDGTMTFYPVLAVSLAGLLWLIKSHAKLAIAGLTVPVLLALSVFIFGNRVLIFWGRLVGLGLAFCIDNLINRFKRREFLAGAAVTAIMITMTAHRTRQQA